MIFQKTKISEEGRTAMLDPFVRYAEKSTYFIDAKVVAPDCRILYILSGEGRFETGDRSLLLMPGTLVYYPGGTPYHICSTEGLLFYTLNFDLTRRYVEQYPSPFYPRRDDRWEGLLLEDGMTEELSSVLYLREARFAEAGLRRIYEESVRPSAHSDEAKSACLKLLLIDLLRDRAVPVESPLVCRIKALVSEDLRRNNAELAGIMGYHPYYLNEIFSRETGKSLHQYVMKERAAKARELITGSDRELADIAEQCGFSSLSYLSRALRSEYGVTPSRMRKM